MAGCTSDRKGYKWFVLVAACFSQMLRAGFIAGTLTLFSIYYTQRYHDRTLSSNIGSAQLSVANLAAFPAVMLNKKIGERWTQIIGGVLTVGGMASTAFTTEAWQALLSNSLTTGLGAAFLAAATYSTLSRYFPGNQLAPYAAITVCQNIGVMATPQIIGMAMENIGFQNTFLVCAGTMSINILCGLVFLPTAKKVEEKRERRNTIGPNIISLKFSDKKQGIYRLPDTSEISDKETVGAYHKYDPESQHLPRCGSSSMILRAFGLENDIASKHEQLSRVALSNILYSYEQKSSNASFSVGESESKSDGDADSLATVESFGSSATESSVETTTESLDSTQSDDMKKSAGPKAPTMYQVVSESHGESIANLLDDSAIAKQSLKKVFKSKAALNFLLTSFITTGGYVAYNSNVGDYCTMSLKYEKSDFVLGLTILGISQLVTGILYLVATRFLRFSVSFVYVVAIIGSAGITFSLLSGPSIEIFYVIMVFSGFFKSMYIAASFGTGMEVTSPSIAVVMFMVVTFVEGIGGIVFPYISSYLQVQVNLSAGMIAAGSVQLLGGLTLLPLSIHYLVTPKDYNKKSEYRVEIEQTGYQPNRTF